MKYLYKQTGVIVESGISLDSSLFAPMNDEPKDEAKAEEPVKKSEQKATVRKTAASKTASDKK